MTSHINKTPESIFFLNSLLANEYTLFTKTLNYHWNVTGPRFHSLHNFLEGHYKELLTVMDDLAERVRILDETPLSTVNEMNTFMSMTEKNGAHMSGHQMIKDLFDGHTQIIESIKEANLKNELFKTDPGTEDFLISLLQKHEKMNWMLKSHID